MAAGETPGWWAASLARVQDVSEWLHNILTKGEQPEVIVHIGINEMGWKRGEVMQKTYKQLGKRTSRLHPVPCASEGRKR